MKTSQHNICSIWNMGHCISGVWLLRLHLRLWWRLRGWLWLDSKATTEKKYIVQCPSKHCLQALLNQQSTPSSSNCEENWNAFPYCFLIEEKKIFFQTLYFTFFSHNLDLISSWSSSRCRWSRWRSIIVKFWVFFFTTITIFSLHHNFYASQQAYQHQYPQESIQKQVRAE